MEKNKITWKDAIMDKKMVAVLVYIMVAAFSIVMNINSRIEVNVNEKVSTTIEQASKDIQTTMKATVENIYEKLDRQENQLASIEERMDQEKIETTIEVIIKQAEKIRKKNWQDIHLIDINKAISGYAKLVAQGHDPGELAKLEKDIIVIKKYNSDQLK